MWSRNGLSLIEVMVALVLLGVGILAGVGTLALAWRTALNGDRLAASARRSTVVLDSLRQALAAAGHRCSALSNGRDSGVAGSLAWVLQPSAGGLIARLELGYATRPASGDTGWTFFPCES